MGIPMGEDEVLESEFMKYAALVLVSLSVFVFLMQRFVLTLFDPAFEFCIFHLSAILSLFIYLWERRALKTSRGGAHT
ncbi:hypothetical protein CW700_06865 [Candidatus Bathyarchaeota archaeon]|nr:MAG: hypothetical protein CW700_06865 [Candidatus Bathyarchaeota archaeon]